MLIVYGHPLAQVTEAQKVTIRTLETQLDARTQEACELRAQVVGLLEWRRPDVSTDVQAGPVTVPPVARRDLLMAALIVGAVACAWAWSSDYRP